MGHKDDELKHDSIIFLDNDSLPVNFNTRFHLENDTMHALRPVCTPYEHDSNKNGVKQTVYSCKIVFDKFDTFTSFPYCVALKAVDTTIISPGISMAKTKICLVSSTNPKSKSRSDNFFPRAEALKERRFTSFDQSNSVELDDSDIFATRPKKNRMRRGAEKITYPKNVTIFKSATNFSRVVQPLNLTDLAKEQKLNFGFQLESKAINGLNITKNGGIVYVMSSGKLSNVIEGIYPIKISWQNYSAMIDVHVKEGNYSNLNKHGELSSCAMAYDEFSCLGNISIGTSQGKCQWRPPTNTSNLSKIYGTCTTDLEHCPNNYCDPLEALGQKLNKDICPQDCVTHVYSARTNENGVGIYSGVGVCTCEVGKCTCMPASAWTTTTTTTIEPFADSTKQRIVEHRPKKVHHGDYGWIIVASAVFFVIFMLIFAMFRVRNNNYKRKLKEQELMHIEKLKSEPRVINIEIPLSSTEDGKIKYNFDAKWEVKRENIVLEETIGEGEFGKVVRGQALHLPFTSTVNTTVAVKMLKTGANNFELLALMSEYEMLQDLSHPNIIRLLGACTTAETPLLIIEYCHFGSLKNFLKLSRNPHSKIEYINQVEPMTEKDVLSFAWQISKGMSYLADMKLVHRDLAARNILVAEGKICKISDFGLTRDIYEDDAYLKKSKDRVPVKWMAPESLSDQVYTIKSDVWSYGVLCWEIITLGATPYPAVPLQSLYSLLMSGYRMPRPKNCSDEIYSIIQSCWVIESQKRPNFDALMKKWEELLTRGAKYLEMAIPDDAEPTPKDSSDEVSTTEVTELSYEDSCVETDVMLRNPVPSAPLMDIRHSEHMAPLWTPPLYDSPEIKGIDNHKYFADNSTIKSWQAGYDFPKTLIDSKTTDSDIKSNRYENEPPKHLLFARMSSHQDLKSELIKANSYDVPINSNKRVKSYLEMDKLDQHVQNNLKNELKAEKLGKNLDAISFKFVSNGCLIENENR
uniref:CSON008578 protein n=1 Tax=Culicoides sonorensis TaxID=179676 RepID=A0A336MYT0_CULSO